MDHDQVTALFTRGDGSFHFARWARPIVPVVFGVEDQTLPVIKGAIEAVVVLAGHKMDEVDTELVCGIQPVLMMSQSERPRSANNGYSTQIKTTPKGVVLMIIYSTVLQKLFGFPSTKSEYVMM